jgi:tripeptide aminopeptidase
MTWNTQLEERLIRYCAIATPSDPSSPSSPSTDCQWDLLRLLQTELQEMGATEIELGQHGHLSATIPGNSPGPTIAWMAHVDTSSQFTATDVKPLVHRNYQGQDIVLPDDPAQVISPSDCAYLGTRLGHDIVTASGKSLLGADDKAGVAILMTLADHLLRHPEIPRARTRLCFTPDEEIGRGVTHLDVEKLGAEYAYTLDGAEVGELCYETFSADKAVVEITGVSIHPGWAKDKLVNALYLASQIVSMLPKQTRTPETTSGREGFIHVSTLEGTSSHAKIQMALRDFELEGLASHRELIEAVCKAVNAAEPRAQIDVKFISQYRNMRYWMDTDNRPVQMAAQAYRACAYEPRLEVLRGGTDGSWLTERGLSTPNLFTGMQNVHGPLEWVSVQDMAESLKVCLELVQLWAKEPAKARPVAALQG